MANRTLASLRKVPPVAWAVGSLGLSLATLLYVLRKKSPTRIALIGDSLAVGLGPQLAKLAKAGNVPFQYESHVGSTCATWIANPSWGAWVPAFAPTAVFVELGTNDLGYSPAPPVAPYTSIVNEFGQYAQVIWIDPPIMPNDRLAGVRSVIASLGVPVVPAATGLAFSSDNIHPIASSYAAWAKFIMSALGADQ